MSCDRACFEGQSSKNGKLVKDITDENEIGFAGLYRNTESEAFFDVSQISCQMFDILKACSLMSRFSNQRK